MTRLPYAVVIATRNRPAALRLSIPLMASQAPRPAQIIVVDSSDDHGRVREAVEAAVAGYDGEVVVLKSRAGSSLQRNIGIQRVSTPVTFFPDDDSLWFPGVADAVLRVYERDDAGAIGAVCAAESVEPPPGFDDLRPSYELSPIDRVRQMVASRRARIERFLFPDPFVIHGRSRWNVRQSPSWLREEDAVLVEWMTGFRMSFRTEVIRQFGFEEVLGDYALNEDIDASFHTMRGYLVVGARRAKVYHHRFPGRRQNGVAAGVFQLLNRAYVVCRHSPPGSLARRQLKRYGWYKLSQYAAAANSRYGRERIAGAWRALRMMDEILQASPEDLSATYARVRDRCLGLERAGEARALAS